MRISISAIFLPAQIVGPYEKGKNAAVKALLYKTQAQPKGSAHVDKIALLLIEEVIV
jgi:hypothetical protein